MAMRKRTSREVMPRRDARCEMRDAGNMTEIKEVNVQHSTSNAQRSTVGSAVSAVRPDCDGCWMLDAWMLVVSGSSSGLIGILDAGCWMLVVPPFLQRRPFPGWLPTYATHGSECLIRLCTAAHTPAALPVSCIEHSASTATPASGDLIPLSFLAAFLNNSSARPKSPRRHKSVPFL